MALELELLKEIRDDVKDLKGEMHGMATKVTSLEVKQASLEALEHEKRIRDLEHREARLMGWALGAAAAASLLIGIIMKLVWR